MKPLLIGNSHTGCILLAAKARGIEIDTFGIPGGLGPDLEIRNGRAHKGRHHGKEPKTNIAGALAEGVTLSKYDYIVFSTLGAADPQFMNRHHPLVNAVLAEMAEILPGDVPRVSRSFMEFLIRIFFDDMYATKSLAALARSVDSPILVQPVPVPAVLALDPDITPLSRYYGAAAAEVMSWYMKFQFGIMRDFVDGLGTHVRLLPYPLTEALETGFAPDSYGVGSNAWHMSSKYGALILDQIDSALTASV